MPYNTTISTEVTKSVEPRKQVLMLYKISFAPNILKKEIKRKIINHWIKTNTNFNSLSTFIIKKKVVASQSLWHLKTLPMMFVFAKSLHRSHPNVIKCNSVILCVIPSQRRIHLCLQSPTNKQLIYVTINLIKRKNKIHFCIMFQ